MTTRDSDLIIYGASSFVGQIMTRYLAEHIGFSGTVKWAIAGRSPSKLNELRASLGEVAANLPIIIADADDVNALAKLCQSTRVIATTVGPYALYGEQMVKACAENGTDYCDLCGEAYWIKRMIVKYADAAEQTGARIVSGWGFVCIFSALGVHCFLWDADRRIGEFLTAVKFAVHTL